MSGPVWVEGGGVLGVDGLYMAHLFGVYLKPNLLLLRIDFGSSETFRAQHIKQNPS